jgi:hypothetical protein
LETPEQKNPRQIANKESIRKRKYRELETPEQKNPRQIANKESMQKRRLSMTPEKADVI